MIELRGSQSQAKVFSSQADEAALDQIQKMLDHPITSGSQVRIMPDYHLGKGSTIGTTIQLPEDRQAWKLSPNVVGVDIGCGMLSYQLEDSLDKKDFKLLDQTIKAKIPSGKSVHQKSYRSDFDEEAMDLIQDLQIPLKADSQDRLRRSIGTLGGGNHFIELTQDEEGLNWLTVHSGSRNLGVRVASHYQDLADQENPTEEKNLNYLTGPSLERYLDDMALAQAYATLNRQAMLDKIVESLGLTVLDRFDSVHNYIDLDRGIIRKGATSAQAGERLLIPLNMKEGSLIAVGKGNPDWNYSAPHGAGRRLSRSQARKQLKVNEFQQEMKGIYSSSVNSKTIDEAPAAYKDSSQILGEIDDTVTISHRLKPLYNFKSNH